MQHQKHKFQLLCMNTLNVFFIATLLLRKNFLFRLHRTDTAFYNSAFVGGVMTLEEITRVNDSQALNSAIEKLFPGSVEGGAVLHVSQVKWETMRQILRNSTLFSSFWLFLFWIGSRALSSQLFF